jgi:HEAT repeat protein
MTRMRWRMRTLMGLILVVAFLSKGFVYLRSKYIDASRRQAFLAQLSIFNPGPALPEPVLVAALDDADPAVRHSAVWALDSIGSTSPALVRALVSRLESETEEMRRQNRRDPHQVNPASTLKRIKPSASFIAPLLRKAMASEEPWVRLQAADVLCDVAGRSGTTDPTLAELLLAALQDRQPAIRMHAPEALAHLEADARRKAVVVLLEQLRGPDRPAQFLAAIGLARFGQKAQAAVAILTDRLRDSGAAPRLPDPLPLGQTDPAAKSGVPVIVIRSMTPGEPGQEVGGVLGARLLDLYLLGRLGSIARPAVPEVVRAMTSSDAEQYVPFFLNAFSPRQGTWHSFEVERLMNSGESSQSPSNLCDLGAAALGRIGPEAERQAVDLLVGILRGEDESQRLGAADALGSLGPKASAAFPTLLGLAEQEKPGPPGGDDGRAIFRLTTALQRVCKGDDPRLVAALIRLLKSRDATKRSGAATTLSELRPPPPAAVPALIEALKDETQSVRFSASLTLGRYQGSEGKAALPALLDALRDEDEGVRSHAAKALANHQVDGGRVVPTVVRLLRSENPAIRSQAAEILGAFGSTAGPAAPALLEGRHDAVRFVRDEVEKALKAIGNSIEKTGKAPGPCEK